LLCLLLSSGSGEALGRAEASELPKSSELEGEPLDSTEAPAPDDEEESSGTNLAAAHLMDFPEDDGLTRQLTVELSAMGFRIEEGNSAGGPAPVQIRWVSRTEIELTLADGSRLSMVRPDELPERMFAVRVAEQARASLLLSGVEQATPPPEFSPPSVPVAEPGETPSPPRFYGELGGAVQWADDGFGAAVQAAPSVFFFPSGHLGIELWGAIGLHPWRVEGPEGVGELWLHSGGIGLVARQQWGTAVVAWLSMGGGGAFGTMSGEAAAERRAAVDRVNPALAYLSGALSYALGESLYLKGQARGVRYLPELTMKFGERVAARRTWAFSGRFALGISF